MHPARTALPLLALAVLAAAPARLAAQERTVPVRLTEYQIALPDSLKQGEVIFSVTNAGTQPHSFVLRGNRAQLRSRVLAPGESVAMPARLRPGGYTAYCAMKAGGEHSKMGMEKALRVVW